MRRIIFCKNQLLSFLGLLYCALFVTAAYGQAPASPVKKPATPAPVTREDRRYDGKPFDYWQQYLRTELKAERRLDAVRAMSKFAACGYHAEAAAALVEIIKEYKVSDLSSYGDPKQPDEKVIRQISDALITCGPRTAAIYLKQLDDEKVRVFLLNRMMRETDRDKLFTPTELPILIRFGTDKKADVRAAAITILGLRLTPEIRKALVPALTKEKAMKPFVGAVVKVLENGQENALFGAMDLAAALGPRAHPAIPALVRLQLRGYTSASEVLKAIDPKSEDVIPLLIKGLRSEDVDVRQRAAEGLAKMGTSAKDAVPALVSALKAATVYKRTPFSNDSNWTVRNAIIEALEKIHANPKLVVPALIEVVKNSEYGSQLRYYTISVLASFGTEAKDAVPVVLQMLKKGEPFSHLRHESGLSIFVPLCLNLQKMGGSADKLVPLQIRALENAIKWGRERIPVVRDSFGEIILTGDTSAKEIACYDLSIKSLGKFGPEAKDAVPILLKAYNHYKETKTRILIAETLGKIGPAASAALPILREALQAEDAALRRAAGAAIKKIEKGR